MNTPNPSPDSQPDPQTPKNPDHIPADWAKAILGGVLFKIFGNNLGILPIRHRTTGKVEQAMVFVVRDDKGNVCGIRPVGIFITDEVSSEYDPPDLDTGGWQDGVVLAKQFAAQSKDARNKQAGKEGLQ